MKPRREWQSYNKNWVRLRQKSKLRARSSYPTGGFCEGAKSSDTWTLVGTCWYKRTWGRSSSRIWQTQIMQWKEPFLNWKRNIQMQDNSSRHEKKRPVWRVSMQSKRRSKCAKGYRRSEQNKRRNSPRDQWYRDRNDREAEERKGEIATNGKLPNLKYLVGFLVNVQDICRN